MSCSYPEKPEEEKIIIPTHSQNEKHKTCQIYLKQRMFPIQDKASAYMKNRMKEHFGTTFAQTPTTRVRD